MGKIFQSQRFCRVVLLLIMFFASVASANSSDLRQPKLTPQNAEVVQVEVERLAEAAYKYRSAFNFAKAEDLFKKALVLNEPFAAIPNPRKCLGHSSAQFFIVGSLISMYEQQQRWAEAELLYETKEYSICPATYVDEHVAELLAKQGKYKEARAILRKFVPQMTPPVSIGCGLPMQHYTHLKQLLKVCEERTPNASDAELDEIERLREAKRATRAQLVPEHAL